MNTKTFIKLLCFLAILTIAIGCNSKQKQADEQSKSINLDIKNNAEDQIVFFRFPSPDEILAYVQEANLEFKYNIINSPDNVNTYNTQTKQILNLGVYATDIAYLAVFKENDNMYKYLNAINTLCQALKIDGAFPEEFIKSSIENMNNIDSLANSSEQAFLYISDYLEGNGNNQTLALLTLGTYVESLYLVFNSVDDYDSHPELIQIISDQKFAFENLDDFIKQNINKDFYKEHFEIIGKVNQVYKRMSKVEVPTSKEKSGNDKLVIGSNYTYLLSEKDFNELKSMIIEKRNSIVNDSIKN